MVSTDATVPSATLFRYKPVFGRAARITRPCQVVVQGTSRIVSSQASWSAGSSRMPAPRAVSSPASRPAASTK